MERLRSRPGTVLVVLGAVLLGVGGVALAGAGTATIGWFAYAPVSETAFPDDFVLLTTRHRVALTMLALGALLLSAAAGFTLGRRAPAAPTATNVADD